MTMYSIRQAWHPVKAGRDGMHETYSPQLFNCSAVLVKQEAIQNIVTGLNGEKLPCSL